MTKIFSSLSPWIKVFNLYLFFYVLIKNKEGFDSRLHQKPIAILV